MRVFVFFSVHEPLFHAIAEELHRTYGVDEFGGFVWGRDQLEFLEATGIPYDPLNVFSRDILPELDGAPDLAYLERCEATYGVPINRMIFSERHLLKGRTFSQVLRLTEGIFRLVERTYEDWQPDWIFSEDVSGLTSYIHWAVARGMGIPCHLMGRGRLPRRITVYDNQFQQWDRTDALYEEMLRRGLTDREREEAARFREEFLARRERPTGMATRAQLPVATCHEMRVLAESARRRFVDPQNPTRQPPLAAIANRLRRVWRDKTVGLTGLFERPEPSERFVLYPLAYQPEATTLVLAPYCLDQLALIEDIAKSLPVGYRLYVKEHLTSRGRREFSFYRRLRDTYGVRLLGPHEDSWQLIQDAAAIALITGNMGWEGLLYEKPVITFGRVSYNTLPMVYRAGTVAREDWAELFRRAIFEHESDRETLLTYIAAALRTTYPGFMGTPWTFPEAMDPENVAQLASALATSAGLTARAGANDECAG